MRQKGRVVMAGNLFPQEWPLCRQVHNSWAQISACEIGSQGITRPEWKVLRPKDNHGTFYVNATLDQHGDLCMYVRMLSHI